MKLATETSQGRASDVSALASVYARDGFVNAGKFFDDAELDLAARDLENIADVTIRGKQGDAPALPVSQWGPDHFQIIGAHERAESFARITTCAPLLRVAAALLKANTLQLWADVVHYKSAVTGGVVNWHQDGASHKQVRPARRVIAAWVALDDATIETGCMWMAPGSHRWGPQENYLRTLKLRGEPILDIAPPEGQARDEWRGVEACPVRRGEVHFHHAHTWHGSTENRSARPRRGYTMFLMADGVMATERNGLGLEAGALMSDAADKRPIVYRA